MPKHEVEFHQCVEQPTLYRAVCSCEWMILGPLTYLQAHAATHKLDNAVNPHPEEGGP